MGEWWGRLWQGIAEDFSDLADVAQFARLSFRLVLAALLGGVLGYERQQVGKAAGLRTHMLVSLGAALMILAPSQAGIALDHMSRVVQGIVTGIGFLGAGAILKRSEQGEIHGLTTAASIWTTAAVGVAAGMGRHGLAVLGVALAWVILKVLSRLEGHDPAGPRSE